MPAWPAADARQGMARKKAARSCQSRLFRKVIIVGSRKSLLALHACRGCQCQRRRLLLGLREHAQLQLYRKVIMVGSREPLLVM